MIRGVVCWFAALMDTKLQENDYKGGWDQDKIEQLLYKLECEVIELKNTFECLDSPTAVVSECADVANFAMMIADKMVRE